MGKGLISKTPKISVVMSVYNGERFLREAIDSILNQTYKDFEFIIVNDGSTDRSEKIIRSYKDKRIRLINQKNHGLVYSLNKGVKLARSDLIARMDADDVSEENRLEKQIKFIKTNKSVTLVGSSMTVIDESSKIKHIHHVLIDDPELKQELLVRSPFAHGSVIFDKKKFIKAGMYKISNWPAEDYGLWLDISKHGNFYNINEPLYRYRENSNGISSTNNHQQIMKSNQIRKKAYIIRGQLLAKKIDFKKYIALDDGLPRLVRMLDDFKTINNSLWSLEFRNKYYLLVNRLILKKIIKSHRT